MKYHKFKISWKLNICLLLSGIAFSSLFAYHAFYFGVVEIKHEANANEATVLVKVFQDDLENALRNAALNLNKENTNIADSLHCTLIFIPPKSLKSSFCETNETLLHNYFDQHLKIVVNHQSLNLVLVESLAEGDVYWLNFSVNCPTNWQQTKVVAPFFTEIYPIQNNVIQLFHQGDKRFGRVSKQAPIFEVEW